MKKLFIILGIMMLVLMSGTAAFARSSRTSSSGLEEGSVEGDASLVVASGPASGFGSTVGFTLGGGMMIPNVPNLQGRVDLSYLSWSASEFGFDLTYTRIPFLFSARYYFPVQSNLKLYAQAGLEVSFDTVEASTIVGFTGFGQPIYGKSSASETNVGLTPGGGIELTINPKLSFVADLRIHTVTDSYFTVQGGLAYKF